MRCCVPLCTNTSDNASTSERTGITFRRLPNEVILRTAWLRPLGTEDHHLPDPAVICSQHFSDDNFLNIKRCVRQIHSNCNASTVQVDKSAVEAVVIKKEDCSVYEDNCVSNEKYSNISIKIELEPLDEAVETLHRNTVTSSTTVAGYVIKAESCKSESITFGCTVCYQDFVQENAYNEHMSMHLKDAGSNTACDASQVCEPRAAVSRSGDSLVLQNKTGSQRLSDESPPAAGCAPAVVSPLSASVEANENPVTEESAEKQESDKLYKRHSEPGIKPYYSCNICDFRGKYESAVIRHVAGHTGLKPYSCDLCSFRGSRKYNLATHMITHTGDKRHTCVMCDYKCARSSDLVRHIRTHTAVKPICCVLCNYRCAQNSDLLKHMRTHSGEKPCSCEFCDYKCAGNSDLLKHMRTHAGVKPYSCDVCNYKCARKSYLFKHKIIHTGEKPYTCETCGYKCSRKFNLLKHTKTHSN